MNRWGAALRTRPVAFTLLLAACVLTYQIWIGWGANNKLQASGLLGRSTPSPVEITLTVDPEQFHMVILQEAGRLIRVEKRQAFLKDVPPDMLRSLARRYWISRISAWIPES